MRHDPPARRHPPTAALQSSLSPYPRSRSFPSGHVSDDRRPAWFVGRVVSHKMVKYGFIGIGIMGRGMAMNLVKKGFDVTVGAPWPARSLPRRCATAHGASAPLRTVWDAWSQGRGCCASLLCKAGSARAARRGEARSHRLSAACACVDAGLEPLRRQVQGPR